MIKKKIVKPSILVLTFLLLAVLLLGGCTTTAVPQGWSGCIAGPANIYYGSLDGKLVSISPEARAAKLPFPNREHGEFSTDLVVSTGGGSLCGPMFSCTSAARNDVVYCTPAASDNLVYVATYSGFLYALNPAAFPQTSNDVRWEYPKRGGSTLGSIIGNMVLSENNIFMASANGFVYAFTQQFGDKMWEFNAGDKIWTTPAYTNGTLFAGTFEGNLFSIVSKTGKENWKIKLPSAEASAPVVFKDKIVLGTFDRNLYAVS
jgi:outer membrane protein assembly factor BamB